MGLYFGENVDSLWYPIHKVLSESNVNRAYICMKQKHQKMHEDLEDKKHLGWISPFPQQQKYLVYVFPQNPNFSLEEIWTVSICITQEYQNPNPRGSDGEEAHCMNSEWTYGRFTMALVHWTVSVDELKIWHCIKKKRSTGIITHMHCLSIRERNNIKIGVTIYRRKITVYVKAADCNSPDTKKQKSQESPPLSPNRKMMQQRQTTSDIYRLPGRQPPLPRQLRRAEEYHAG